MAPRQGVLGSNHRTWGERNTAVTTYFGENEFFTKMNTIFNVTDSDKFLKLLYK